MSTALIFLLLLAFSICMVVGLVTVLQDLVNQQRSSLDDGAQGSLLQDQSSDG